MKPIAISDVFSHLQVAQGTSRKLQLRAYLESLVVRGVCVSIIMAVCQTGSRPLAESTSRLAVANQPVCQGLVQPNPRERQNGRFPENKFEQ